MNFSELLANDDCNVFGIDWSALESWTDYIAAAKTSLEVGTHVGKFVSKLAILGLSSSNTHIIGHSLGAQASGHLGREYIRGTGNKVGRITGLDPAKPWFDFQDVGVKLSKNDAHFVDIIHTNSGSLLEVSV